ncbi:uncharacterized protein NMK_1973 [Novimethylophilus kurashikiensis]|uniref:Uncharacterized protein n=1 Tax=Novimethylophilus kurashikiensis TaxID=1825523 RepID=A0A2R5FCK3_9PROT|nr:hypothetical protein [Novimethylophilus kurashikiensis]GBG14374.1 uncharacterized protein NMK_1973 [Novimethylophilus kurashikiensis]
MSKKIIAMLIGAMGFQAAAVLADAGPGKAPTTDTTMRCDAPVLNVPADTSKPALYVVDCHGADATSIAPSIRFAGEALIKGTPPYLINAAYTISSQSEHATKLGQLPRADQVATGVLKSSAVSSAALPAQFAHQIEWDAPTGTLSVEESAGVWRAYNVNYADAVDEPGIVESGLASTPVINGRASSKVVLGPKVSRFAGKAVLTQPVVKAELRLRDGKLEVQMGETRVANQDAVQGALLALDRKPADMTRAWALASRAQYLGLDDEVHYAERKVAEHNPQLLEEFQQNVARIKPYSQANQQ